MRYLSIFIAIAAIFVLSTSIPAQAQVVKADTIQQDRGHGHGGGYQNPGRGGGSGHGGRPAYQPPRHGGPRTGYHNPRSYHGRQQQHHHRRHNSPGRSYTTPFPFIPVPIPVPFFN